MDAVWNVGPGRHVTCVGEGCQMTRRCRAALSRSIVQCTVCVARSPRIYSFHFPPPTPQAAMEKGGCCPAVVKKGKRTCSNMSPPCKLTDDYRPRVYRWRFICDGRFRYTCKGALYKGVQCKGVLYAHLLQREPPMQAHGRRPSAQGAEPVRKGSRQRPQRPSRSLTSPR